MVEYKSRIVDDVLKEKLDYAGAVLIEGPKWCGKTTTALEHSNSYVQMDEPKTIKRNIMLATMEPDVLLSGNTPRLFDEWQVVPELWDSIRHAVDRRSKFGQFILTGSAVPADKTKIRHSGTGRFSWLKMRSMTLFESNESNGEIRLSELFDKKKIPNCSSDSNLESLAYQICRGGWPLAINMNEKAALQLAYNYYDAVVNSDINRADGYTKDPNRVRRLLRSYARNTATQASINTLRQDIRTNDSEDLNDNTIYSYTNALKNIFVIEDMPAWNPNLRSKTAIRTSETKYFSDPSIAIASLGLGPKDLLNDLNTLGLMFESMAVRDLRVYSQKMDGEVYHYRDSYGLECDSVIHLRNGDYGLIEIKLGGDNLIEEGAKNLNKLTSQIDYSKMKQPSFRMVLIGVGPGVYQREDGVFVVPLNCLRD